MQLPSDDNPRTALFTTAQGAELLELRSAQVQHADRERAGREREERLRYNFISCLILAAQNGFWRDVQPFLALCRETWSEEQWWDAVKDLPLGRVVREGPTRRGATVPFGFDLGPFSAGRTHVMYAAQAGDVARLAWLLARGARLELKDRGGRRCFGPRGRGARGRRGSCLRGAPRWTLRRMTAPRLCTSPAGRATWRLFMSCLRGAPRWTLR